MKELWADPEFRAKQKQSLAHRRPRGEARAEREERKHRRELKHQMRDGKRKRPRRSAIEREEIKKETDAILRTLPLPFHPVPCNACHRLKPESLMFEINDDGCGTCFECYYKKDIDMVELK